MQISSTGIYCTVSSSYMAGMAIDIYGRRYMQNDASRPILNTGGQDVRKLEGVLVPGIPHQNDLACSRALRMPAMRTRVLGSLGAKCTEAPDQIASGSSAADSAGPHRIRTRWHRCHVSTGLASSRAFSTTMAYCASASIHSRPGHWKKPRCAHRNWARTRFKSSPRVRACGARVRLTRRRSSC